MPNYGEVLHHGLNCASIVCNWWKKSAISDNCIWVKFASRKNSLKESPCSCLKTSRRRKRLTGGQLGIPTTVWDHIDKAMVTLALLRGIPQDLLYKVKQKHLDNPEGTQRLGRLPNVLQEANTQEPDPVLVPELMVMSEDVGGLLLPPRNGLPHGLLLPMKLGCGSTKLLWSPVLNVAFLV